VFSGSFSPASPAGSSNKGTPRRGGMTRTVLRSGQARAWPAPRSGADRVIRALGRDRVRVRPIHRSTPRAARRWRFELRRGARLYQRVVGRRSDSGVDRRATSARALACAAVGVGGALPPCVARKITLPRPAASPAHSRLRRVDRSRTARAVGSGCAWPDQSLVARDRVARSAARRGRHPAWSPSRSVVAGAAAASPSIGGHPRLMSVPSDSARASVHRRAPGSSAGGAAAGPARASELAVVASFTLGSSFLSSCVSRTAAATPELRT
jgi:hypothetical protein